MRNAGIAAGAGAVVGLTLYASFRFGANTMTRLFTHTYRVLDHLRGRTSR